MAVIFIAVSSCSKDAKINRRIEGEWKVVSIGNEVLSSNYTLTMKFIKDEKKNGSGTITEVDNGTSETTSFTYNVSDEKITLVVDGIAEVLTVKKYEKEKLEFLDSYNEIWVLDPK
jgi:hypothetical protein